jgi:hypothetical protein
MAYLYKKTGGKYPMWKGNVVRYELESVLVAFYNAGLNNLILKSTDGTNFSQSGTVSFGSISDSVYSKNLDRFVAVGSGNKILYSNGSTDWNIVTSSVSPSNIIQSVCYSESLGRFVAVTNTEPPLWSNDGINWTFALSGQPSLDVIWIDSLSKFVSTRVSGSPYVQMSDDGKNWTTYTGLAVQDIAYSDTLNLFVGINTSISDFCVSATGSSWTDLGLTMSVPISFRDVAWSPIEEIFVAVGVASDYPASPARQVAYSYDGYIWGTASCPPNDWIRVIWSDEFESFFATTLGNYNQAETFMKSSDGINWTEIISGSFSGGAVLAIASGKYIL